MQQPETIQCPICRDPVEKMLFRFHIDNERQVIDRIREHYPQWSEMDGACGRCVDYYHTELVMQHRMLPEIGPHFPVRSLDDFIILPAGIRLNADPRFNGKGVTICFIDSGFYPHPDLVTYRNRIKKMVNITHPEEEYDPCQEKYRESAWHGTMTTVVCAGDGYLSQGLYKGIASEADLVLLKVQDDYGRISSDSLQKALQWVKDHHLDYGIRIVNMSVTDDEAVSYKSSRVDQLAEELIAEGIIVVAAAGNDEQGLLKPPANGLNVISVGGLDDGNSLDGKETRLYHSTYGMTTDGLMKPELIAPAIWIAAPILPGSAEQQESAMLHHLHSLDDEAFLNEREKINGYLSIRGIILEKENTAQARQIIRDRIGAGKYISPHYMHVDGTSFAAPILCAVIAQVLEINPALSAAQVRSILLSTAKRLKNFPAERQGFGVVQPRKAILKILNRDIMNKPETSPQINQKKKTIGFYVQHDCASQISLSGSFNHWEQDVLLLEPGKNGMWKIEIPMLPSGKYQYKFLVDDKAWIEDVNNPYREPDGFSGFNSILIV